MKRKTYLVPSCIVINVAPVKLLLNPGSTPYPDPNPDYDEDEETGDTF